MKKALLFSTLLLAGAAFATTAFGAANEPAPEPMPTSGSLAAMSSQTQKTFLINSYAAEGSGYILYSCDSVERSAMALLARLGATDINARCTGSAGSPEVPVLSPTLEVKFTSTRLLTHGPILKGKDGKLQAHWQNVMLNGDDCYLDKDLLGDMAPYFDVNGLQTGLDRMNCGFRNKSFRLQFSVLMPN